MTHRSARPRLRACSRALRPIVWQARGRIVGKLACMALLAVGCTTANPAFEDANADADAGTRGDEGTTTSSSTDTGSDAEGSATAGSAATSDASAGDSSGGGPECPEACDANASCVEAGSGPACACDPGYEGDGSECVPVPTLEPVMWQLGCMGNSESCPGLDVCAPEAPMDVHEVNRSATASLMGDPATIYEVKLHLRGVVEPKVYDGGETNEHWNEEPGAVWLGRLLQAYPHAAWLNPLAEAYWPHYQSVGMVHKLLSGRMFPLTLQGLDAAMHELNH